MRIYLAVIVYLGRSNRVLCSPFTHRLDESQSVIPWLIGTRALIDAAPNIAFATSGIHPETSCFYGPSYTASAWIKPVGAGHLPANARGLGLPPAVRLPRPTPGGPAKKIPIHCNLSAMYLKTVPGRPDRLVLYTPNRV